MKNQSLHKIVVLGGGNFGTCLAQHLAHKGHEVVIWSIEEDVVSGINKNHKNPKYLKTIELSQNISATSDLNNIAYDGFSVIVNAVPTQFMRSVLSQLKGKITHDHLMVCASKGIEIGTHALPGQIISESLSPEISKNAVFLSGPSFAIEVAQRLPTAVSAASEVLSRAEDAQNVFHDSFFRVYTSEDPTGLEVSGALKNVVAIAAGAAKGLGMQANSSAALLTRGLAEITRIGVKLGANPLTFKGLAGVGDLFLTCTSEKSRNFTVGFRLGKGEKLKDIVENLGSVAEGVTTTKAAFQLANDLGVDSPITKQVYLVLYEDKPIQQAVMDLINRDPKAEIELPTT